jgi:hypothetical protein
MIAIYIYISKIQRIKEQYVNGVHKVKIRWLGHVERMEDNAMPKRMLK